MIIQLFLKHLSWLIVILPALACAQLTDNFSDGDFTFNPAWNGDDDLFKINNDLQLQLNDNKEGLAGLFTPVAINDDVQWNCWARLAFSPSGNNNARIYLFAEEVCSACFPDGVFLQLGEAGGNDALRLMRQEDGDTATMINGIPGLLSTSFYCRIKVIYSGGQWIMYADHAGEEDYIVEGTFNQYWSAGEGYFGLACKYTVSNSQNFYFDDVYAGPVIHDTIPPEATGISVISPLSIEITFSEYLDPGSLSGQGIFEFSDGLPSPVDAKLHEEDPSLLILSLADSIPYGRLLYVSVSGLTDVEGNLIIPVTLSFSRYKPRRYDIIINEIMADPSPPQMLPEYEYIELFNTTALPVDLSGWSLFIGESEKKIENASIDPYGYLIMAKEEARASLSTCGSFYGFESFALVNTGQELLLSDASGTVIHALQYGPEWYGDEEKSDGGWSMEMIDPFYPCLLRENWSASNDAEGGSPGRINSVYDINYVVPSFVSACVMDSVRIRVVFDQSMHGNICLEPANFSIDNGIGACLAVLPENHLLTDFTVYPSLPLARGVIYELSYRGKIINCTGDSVYISETLGIGKTERPIWQDIVINEVLFDPFPGGDDYVEIYNRSEKAVSLDGISLGSTSNDQLSPPDTTVYSFYSPCRTLLPGEYLLLCKNISAINKYYYLPDEIKFLEAESFPSYANEQGTVLLFNSYGQLLDAFSYHENMHYPLLNSVEGVSLERIHFDRPSRDATNWQSASQISGFGTPGYLNSQFANPQKVKEHISVSPGIFTPGYDGIADKVNIAYEFDEPGCLGTIMIFDASGRQVRHLVNNELLGTSGVYSWNGTSEARQKVPAGLYIILVEVVNKNGLPARYKKTVVVAPL